MNISQERREIIKKKTQFLISEVFPSFKFAHSIVNKRANEFYDKISEILDNNFLEFIHEDPNEDQFFTQLSFLINPLLSRNIYTDHPDEANDLSDFWDLIVKDFSDAGYDPYYFTFIKKDDPFSLAFTGKIPLTPENFELAPIFVDMEQYQYSINIFRKKDKLSNSENGNFSGYYRATLSHIGWKKQDLFDAITKTGLNVPVTQIIKEKGKDKKIAKSPLSDLMSYKNYKLPGFKSKPYLPKIYYETIYRKLFNTLQNINWAEVCKGKLIKFPNLREIATQEFHFNYKIIKKYKYDQICGALQAESERRRKVKEKLIIKIPKRQPMIVYQPGSQIVTQMATTLGQFAQPVPTPQFVKPIYQRIYNMCSPNSNDTKADILLEASYMGLSEILLKLPQTATKGDFCRVIKRYIEEIEEKKF